VHPTRLKSRLLLLGGLALAAGACRVPGGADGGPAPAFCTAPVSELPDGAAPETPPTLAMVVGTENAAQTQVTTPWHEGDHVPLVAGGQGGFMIRPAFDVTAPAALPEDSAQRTCFAVTMLSGGTGGAASRRSLMQGALGTRIDGTTATYHVPALLGLLSYSPNINGSTLMVTFYLNAAADTANAGYVAMTVVPDSALAP
jgi:hypothetical protein